MFQEMQLWIQNIIENMKLTDYRIGTVIQLNPIKIDFGDNKIITDVGTNILYDERYIAKVLNDNKYKPSFNIGEKLLMLQVAKGQKFIVISKLYIMAEGG